ncbi:MAG: UDP-glucose 4-epimerase GalE [Spirochaetota bacterium]
MILIVGGAGYIGSHINKELTKRGYETLVFDNLIYGHKELCKWGHFILGDLENVKQLRLIFRKYHIDAVMHFSAFTYVGESVTNPQKYYVNNVKFTLNLLQIMLEFNVKNFIFSSTAAIYGQPEKTPILEDSPKKPINPYGKSKLMVEQILEDYAGAFDLKFSSLRYFYASGADPDIETGEWHNPETHLIPLILDAAIGRREDIKIFGTDYDTPDGTCIRDYIHVTDLADAHILALEHIMKGGDSLQLNLGNGSGFSVREVIETVKKVTQKKFKVVETERRPGDPPVLLASNEKAKKILKWKPQYSDLSKIVETAWEWHKKLYGNK